MYYRHIKIWKEKNMEENMNGEELDNIVILNYE